MTAGPTTAGARPDGERGSSGGDASMPPLEAMTSASTPRMDQLEGGGTAGMPESPSDRVGSGAAAGAHYSGVESLAWRGLSYYYRVKGGKGQAAGERAAVTRCTGVVKRGDMVAVMGASVTSWAALGWERGWGLGQVTVYISNSTPGFTQMRHNRAEWRGQVLAVRRAGAAHRELRPPGGASARLDC